MSSDPAPTLHSTRQSRPQPPHESCACSRSPRFRAVSSARGRRLTCRGPWRCRRPRRKMPPCAPSAVPLVNPSTPPGPRPQVGFAPTARFFFPPLRPSPQSAAPGRLPRNGLRTRKKKKIDPVNRNQPCGRPDTLLPWRFFFFIPFVWSSRRECAGPTVPRPGPAPIVAGVTGISRIGHPTNRGGGRADGRKK